MTAHEATPSDAAIGQSFRKRPVVIQAVQLDGTYKAFEAAIAFMGGAGGAFNGHLPDNHPNKSWLYINTLEGQMTASTGDWIIKGVQGEFYPCKPDIFSMTYEPVTAREIEQGRGALPELPADVHEALFMLDIGQKFALCNADHEGTRRDVKKLREHIDVIKAYLVPNTELPPHGESR